MLKETSPEGIRIAIVDDHEMVRRGLSDYFRLCKDFVLVGQAADGEEAVRLCKKMKPDVVLMDLVMPHVNGVEATKQILCTCPATRIIAMSSFDDERLVPAALNAGAISYLQKNITMSELADAVRKAHAGISTLSPLAMQFLISSVTSHQAAGISLTQREREVLQLLVDGKSNAEIAELLVICLPTVKTHVGRVLAKLGVKNRSEAIVFAIKHDLVSAPSKSGIAP
ncbi:MAG TPA: response regulator transcription factor [Anaerolineaceae bacterium]|nr:response regulator transcription factor [Anaerolineaceae bacterium]